MKKNIYSLRLPPNESDISFSRSGRYFTSAVKKLQHIRSGERVFISGYVYTLRDMSQKKLIKNSKKTPLELKNATIYYCAPTLSRDNSRPVGACGPTTTARMEESLDELLKLGVKAIIGKGPISEEAQKLLKKYGCVYLLATGGCGAYYSQFVDDAKVVLFPELGPEAIWRLKLNNFPVLVAYDLKGRYLFSRQ